MKDYYKSLFQPMECQIIAKNRYDSKIQILLDTLALCFWVGTGCKSSLTAFSYSRIKHQFVNQFTFI